MLGNLSPAEIVIIICLALIIIGPEKLPGVIKDIRAAIYAVRKAIRNARAELDGDFGGMEELKKPIAEVAKWRSMGAKGMITHALFDDDPDFMNSLRPENIMSGETVGKAHRKQNSDSSGASPSTSTSAAVKAPKTEKPEVPESSGAAGGSGDSVPRPKDARDIGMDGFSWSDIM